MFRRGGGDELDGDLPDAGEVVAAAPEGPLAAALRSAVLTSEAHLEFDGDEVIEHHGDPTETALLEAALQVGLDPRHVRADVEVLATVPFESDLRYSFSILDEDGPVVRLKGAPERVVELCTSIRDAQGTRDLDRDEVLAAVDEMAERGLRVLAMAERRLDVDPASIDGGHPPEPEGSTLTGMVGMQDPSRPGVKDAIERCREAGIRVLMITGDHAVTARAIARDLGLGDGEAEAVTGAEVEEMSDEELHDLVPQVEVFARVAPEHKLRAVRALQSHDQVVAVTGDGVNDGPALKAADIGVAMGRLGTDVAREASDMVLTDDNFVSIANAVEEGRVVFDNVRKVTFLLLSTAWRWPSSRVNPTCSSSRRAAAPRGSSTGCCGNAPC